MSVIETPTGSLTYFRTGRGPAVLLIQGVGVVGEGWRPQIDPLAGDFELVAFDNQGIGQSSPVSGRLTIEAMAADALAIMNAERIDRFHVVGHSMGGLIAQELALAAPGRVQSLALLCTFDRGRHGTRMSPGLFLTALRMRVGSRVMRRNAFLELVMPGPYLRSQNRAQLAVRLETLFGHDLALQPPIVMKQLRAMGRYDAFDRLARLASIKTLVVSARLDRIALPAYGRVLAAAIPGARFVELPDAGHGVTIQSPQEINALLRDHFVSARSL